VLDYVIGERIRQLYLEIAIHRERIEEMDSKLPARGDGGNGGEAG